MSVPHPATILHITSRAAWEAARTVGRYEGDTLATEGFIHCSTAAQVVATGNRLFLGRPGLVLLEIDAARVGPPIRYENLEGGTEMYPHIYGPLNASAVVAVHEFAPGPNGRFELPPGAPPRNSL